MIVEDIDQERSERACAHGAFPHQILNSLGGDAGLPRPRVNLEALVRHLHVQAQAVGLLLFYVRGSVLPVGDNLVAPAPAHTGLSRRQVDPVHRLRAGVFRQAVYGFQDAISGAFQNRVRHTGLRPHRRRGCQK
jgi:hypothetical protein